MGHQVRAQHQGGGGAGGLQKLASRGSHRREYALVGAAAADIAGHTVDDLLIGGIGICRQQRRRLHDLSGLTVAALRHVVSTPGALHRVITFGIKPLDGGHLLAGGRRDGSHATAHRFTVDVHSAGAAERHAAAELGPGEPELISDVPEQRHVGVAIELATYAVDFQGNHH